MASLNSKYSVADRQRALADFESGVLTVVAGPGTGKTFGLIDRIDHLLMRGATANDIIYVSFTNEIVRKFSEDLVQEFAKRGKAAPDIRTWTLHSLAWRVLRNLGHHLNLPESTVAYSFDDYVGEILLSDLRAILSTPGNQLSASNLKTLLKSYHEVRRQLVPKAQWSPEARSFVNVLHIIHRELQALDWDSVLPAALRAIELEGAVPEWLRAIPHVLADEYQDFNNAEDAFLALVSAGATSRVLVGDHFQSIYGTRGASPKLLLSLAAEPANFSINLVRCRRCPVAVLNGANGILQAMAGVTFPDVRLEPFDPSRNGSLQIVELPSAKKEIDLIASRIREWRSRPEITYADIIGLFTNRDLAQMYRRLLSAEGIPCEAPPDRSEQRERLKAALHYRARPGHPLWQRTLLARFPLVNKRYVGEVRPRLAACDGSLRHAVVMAGESEQWPRKTLAQADAYGGLLDGLVSQDLAQCRSALELACEGSLIGKDEAIQELVRLPLEDLSDPRIGGLADVLVGEAKPVSEDTVRLMTIHGSKGLDRKFVFIPTCEKGVYPGFASSVDEQRRLFYVGVTRAKEELLITYPTSRDSTRSIRRRSCEYALSEFATLMQVPVTRVQ